jgi:DNA-binding Lrp family transcriptional regulator
MPVFSACLSSSIPGLEATVASYDEVIELRRMFGRPDYFIRVAVAGHAACESFQAGQILGLPGVLRVTSHLTMKKIKAD